MWIGPENIFSDIRAAYPRSGLQEAKSKLQAFDFSRKELLYIFKDISENLVQAFDAIDHLVRLDLNSSSAQKDANQYIDDLNRNLFHASMGLEKTRKRFTDVQNSDAYDQLFEAYNAILIFTVTVIRNGLDEDDQRSITDLENRQAFLNYHASNIFEQPARPGIILQDPSTGKLVQGNDPQWQKKFEQIWDIIHRKVPKEVFNDMSFTIFQKVFFDLVPKIQEKGFGLMGAARYHAFGGTHLQPSDLASNFRFRSSRNPDLKPEQIRDFTSQELPRLLEQEMSDFYRQRILPYIKDEIQAHPELIGIGLTDGQYTDGWERRVQDQVTPLCADPWTGISKSTRLNPYEIPQEITNKLFAAPEGINLTGEMKEIIYGEIFPELAAKGIGIPQGLNVAVTFRFADAEVEPQADDFQFSIGFSKKLDLGDKELNDIEKIYIQKEVRQRLENRFKDVCERTIIPRLGQLSPRAKELFKGVRYRAMLTSN